MTVKKTLQASAIMLLLFSTLLAQDTAKRQPQLQVVGTAHLDTQWRWTIQNTINEYVPATFRDNSKLMDIYPNYVFSFEGAFRYMLLREYYPEEWAKLKKYVDSGQWRVAGSWVDAVDVNIPSFESLVRHNLYGNGFYKQQFGKTSRDIFLPDCFGFGYALPSIAAHCGLKSFSTQKLVWGSSVGIPFDIGLWQGVDGSKIIAGLNAGDYTARIHNDLSSDTAWVRKTTALGDSTGLYAGYMYFGTGDTGGSPESLSVAWLDKSLRGDGPIKVHSVGSDDIVNLVEQHDKAKLAQYDGELLMTRHGVGCYTSQAAMKRWNRKNELLADAAERASVIAHLTAGTAYPAADLRDTWTRFLWHQFHDDVTGTSIPEAYEFSWNDEILCQNRFAATLETAVATTAPLLDTKVKGEPFIVMNPLAVERSELVELQMRWIPSSRVRSKSLVLSPYRVFGPDGKQVPANEMTAPDGQLVLQFIAHVPPVSQSVYYVRTAEAEDLPLSDLSATPTGIENSCYRVTLNDNGDVSSVFDKKLFRELLSAPIQYQLLFDKPRQWPAWELHYEDIIKPPQATLGSPAQIEVIEKGPVRAAIRITRRTAVSTFVTTISLVSNSDRIEFKNEIDWYERETLLKVAFPLTCANDSVTYDLGLGAIKRGLNTKQKYEVPGHQWADMTAPTGEYGVSILNDCKYGWDHPEAGILRLTLIHTPGVFESWNWVGDEKSQDNGHHEFTFAITSHAGPVSDSDTPEQAARLNQPLLTFGTESHSGKLGSQFSLLNVDAKASGNNVFVNAVKMSEQGDELIVRVKETKGKAASLASLNFAFPILSAREVNGFEDSLGPVTFKDKSLQFSLTRYQPKAFAVRLKTKTTDDLPPIAWKSVELPFNLDAISLDNDRKDGDIDGKGNSVAGEMLPDTLVYRDIPFTFGPKTSGALNAVSCAGQSIVLPTGDYDELHILACATGGPANAKFTHGDSKYYQWVQDYVAPIAQWNNRLASGQLVEDPAGIAPAYINRQPIAWYGSHRHLADGSNEAYRFTYLFWIKLNLDDVNSGEKLILPNEPRIKIFSITAAKTPYSEIVPSQIIYDVANAAIARVSADSSSFVGQSTVSMTSPTPGARIHYTLDGSDPTESSPAYSGPVVIKATTTVKSRAILKSSDDHFVTAATYRQLVPHTPEQVTGLKPGLATAYFEGEWQKLPGFDSLKAKQSFVADSIALPSIAREEDFGLTFSGYFLAPTEGLYEFSLSSDDGSRLFIGDSLVVENDGLHGGGDVVGQIALKPGYHRLYVPMFQCKGGRELDAHVSGPGLPRERLRENRLFHVGKTTR